jgi:hypothetical protein
LSVSSSPGQKRNLIYLQVLSKRTLAPDWIEVRWHEQKFPEAITRFISQAPLPLEGDVSIQQVIHAYKNNMKPGQLGSIMKPNLYLDMALITCWAMNVEEAKKVLIDSKRDLQKETWGEFEETGGIDLWIEESLRKVGDREQVLKTVEEESAKFKLERIPESDLIV